MRDARSCWAMSSSIWLSMKSRYCWRGHPKRSSRAWRICRQAGEARLGYLTRLLCPSLPSGASEVSTVSHRGREAEARHVGTAQTGGELKGKAPRRGPLWHPAGGPPPRAQLPAYPHTRPTSLEVTLSRSLASSTSHSSARMACSICCCSEGLEPEPVSAGSFPSLPCASPQAPSPD